jgi:hypothetical protein
VHPSQEMLIFRQKDPVGVKDQPVLIFSDADPYALEAEMFGNAPEHWIQAQMTIGDVNGPGNAEKLRAYRKVLIKLQETAR